MRPRSAAVLACRVISIVLGVQVVTQAVSVLIFTKAHLEGTGEFWAITGSTAVIAWFLWIAAVNLSSAMARGTPDEQPATPRPTANVHAIAFSIVGVVLIVQAIPELVAAAAARVDGFGGPFGLPGFGGGGFGFGRDSAIAAGVVRLVIGLILIVAASDLARMLAARYPDPEPPGSTPEPS